MIDRKFREDGGGETGLLGTNPTGERPLELNPLGDKLTQNISLQGTHTTAAYDHHASLDSMTRDYAHFNLAHTLQGPNPQRVDLQAWTSRACLHLIPDSLRENSAILGMNMKRGSLPWSNSGFISPEKGLPTRDTIEMSENIGSVPRTHQGFSLPTTCGCSGRREHMAAGPGGCARAIKLITRTHQFTLVFGHSTLLPHCSSSSELALLILVAFSKRTPSYADTPSCSTGNFVKVHLANRLQPPERTKATPLAVHRILVDVEAVCGVSHLADPSPRSLAQHKGESIGVEKKQRL
ncbi:hypothetical protein DFH09DRAFT_1115676 [Mycena vulgaris]|nr:hypothetical protein DFH09DRAFT_1115676 [Mycena vulgaris]